jgi:uncharacterized membrane protein YkvA (DUF1232 family)
MAAQARNVERSSPSIPEITPEPSRVFRRTQGGAEHSTVLPRSAKIAVAIAGVWVVSPIDLIPEFLPVIGSLDDVVVALALRFAARRVPHEAIYEAWPADPALLDRLLRSRRERSE